MSDHIATNSSDGRFADSVDGGCEFLVYASECCPGLFRCLGRWIGAQKLQGMFESGNRASVVLYSFVLVQVAEALSNVAEIDLDASPSPRLVITGDDVQCVLKRRRCVCQQ